MCAELSAPRQCCHADARSDTLAREPPAYLCSFVPLAFFVIGGPTALLLGYLTDRTVRCGY